MMEIESAHVENDVFGMRLHVTASDGKDASIARIWLEHQNQKVQEAGQKALSFLKESIGLTDINDSDDLRFMEISCDDWKTVLRMAELQEPKPHRKRDMHVHHTPAPVSEPMGGRFVYVISCDNIDEPLCKIGIANSPEKRLKQLSTGSPHALRLELTRYSDNARAVEAAAHSHFSAERRNGEWFSITAMSAINFVNSEAARRLSA